ncbi:MAG: GDSL-type esterase/lipase family protein [Acidimicrobiales bacterium]
MRRYLFPLLLGALAVLTSCADGFAPRGDDDDEKFEEGAAAAGQVARTPEPANATPQATAAPMSRPTATPAPTATPLPTVTPLPTATATPLPTATARPTPTPTPMFPPEILRTPIRAIVGDSTTQRIATDVDGSIAEIQIIEGPEGLTVDGDMLRYIPLTAQSAVAFVQVTDTQGLSVVGEVTLLGRYRGHPQALVALGDSVPAGHGLDLRDYLGGDPCWRASNSFPRRVFNMLNDEGVFPPGQGEFALLACSGADVDDLYEREVTGGFSNITPASGARSQLDWTIRSNPRFVTITIGANDTGFVGPDQLFLDDGVTLDRPQVDRRMAVIEVDLRFVIDEILAKTDATIFVSNYYNPTAESPQGIPTCRRECFKVKADEVLGRMNDVIEDVARTYAPDRVVFVDFETPFVGKGAPNGLGPDGLREGGFGFIGDLLAGQVEDVHPYCARGETVGASWISAADCVHPDERGTAELANILANAVRTHLAANPSA